MTGQTKPWAWTEAEDERLKAFVAQGASVVKAAAALKRKTISVRNRAGATGCPSRRCGSPDRSGPLHRTTFDVREVPRRCAVGASFRRYYNLLMLLRPSNKVFVPASEPRFRVTAGANWSSSPSPGLGAFHSHKFSNPAGRSAKMPAAFCLCYSPRAMHQIAGQVMRIIEILALVLTLAGCTGDRLRQSAIEQPQVMVPI